MEYLTLNGFGYEASVATKRGGSLIRLACPALNAESLRTPIKGMTDNPFLYGTPLIFPPNRIAGGRFSFEGRVYELPVNEPATGCFPHGVLHETPFRCLTSIRFAPHLATIPAPSNTWASRTPFPYGFSISYAKTGLYSRQT